MSISSGYDKFKDYHQTEDGSYKLTSRWTSTNTVELNDGSTVEEKFTEIDSTLNNKVDKVSGKSLSTNDYTTTEKNKLAGIATGAEVNQNAFSNVKVGSTTVAADSKTDTLTLAGSNVTITPDATNDKVTIGITKDNVVAALGYTPPTTNTTYGVATSSALGLVKSGTDITVDSSGNVSVKDDSHNHVISNVDGLQSQLDTINNSLNTKMKDYGSISNVDILDWALSQTNGGTFMVAGDTVTNLPDSSGVWFRGILNVNSSDRGIILYSDHQNGLMYSISTDAQTFKGKGWAKYANQTDVNSKVSAGSEVRFTGIHIGAEGKMPYIYSGNGNDINFRYVDSSGNTKYKNMEKIVTKDNFSLSGTTLTITI